MCQAQIGRNKRTRDACQRSSAADADRRPEGGGGGNRSARQARTNTRAHVVGEAMPHPRERSGGEGEWGASVRIDRSTGNTESLLVASEVWKRFPPPSQSIPIHRINNKKKNLSYYFLLFCEICSGNYSTKTSYSMLLRVFLHFENLPRSPVRGTWPECGTRVDNSSIWVELLK